MNKEKITLIVSNRLQNSIKSSSLVRIENCPLLIYQSCHFIYIILLSLQERIGYSVSLLLLWKRHWWKISKTSFYSHQYSIEIPKAVIINIILWYFLVSLVVVHMIQFVLDIIIQSNLELIPEKILEDNYKWRICLKETIAIQPRIVCHWLLTVILLTNEVAEP